MMCAVTQRQRQIHQVPKQGPTKVAVLREKTSGSTKKAVVQRQVQIQMARKLQRLDLVPQR